MLKQHLIRKKIKIAFANSVKNPPVIVFTAGKVGSSTVYSSLKNALPQSSLFHLHFLSEKGIEQAKLFFKRNNAKIPDHLIIAGFLSRKIRKQFDHVNWKIITLVRDPIAQELSSVYQMADRVNSDLFSKDSKSALLEQIQYLKNRFSCFEETNNSIINWFDRELKSCFGIDVYKYAFNHKDGYQIISQNNVKVLIIRLESMDTCFNRAIKQFLKIDEPIIQLNSNFADQKWYNAQYKFVKNNLAITKRVCDKYYTTRYVQHFYTRDMIQALIEKWVG
ncbi:hypothetical protein GF406_19015 [candidate division KSB1 bacterium]|nr:hypothetical protein [candidate division KSB1 bacterium]